jgi:hypothetical protein
MSSGGAAAGAADESVALGALGNGERAQAGSARANASARG